MTAKLLLDEKFLSATTALIKAAEKEIYIMAYLMTMPIWKKPGKEVILYQALDSATRRGLDCRVILNHTTPENNIVRQNTVAGKWLKSHGIKCKSIVRNRTVHAKMILVDGVTMIIGSHNWSRRAVERNVEASVELREKEVVKKARENFLNLWKEAKWMGTGK